ncbi:kinase-like domain-containing protein [Gaertneriomyces semiglobifer]|nr:kinase-like domain-containing protein [Gaertneriomyces semiglobifer]
MSGSDAALAGVDGNTSRSSNPASPRGSRPSTPSDNALQKRTPADFEFGRLLGEGSYSTVVYACEKSTGKEFAVKTLDKRHIVKEKKVKYVNIEKDVLNRLCHPFIVKLYYTFQDARSLYFVLELAKDGDLLGYIRKLGSFELSGARFYIAEIIEAVDYMHQMGIIHRDLKPENILLDEHRHIKVTDFGTAKILESASEPTMDGSDKSAKRNSFVGTAEYCSPELLNDRAASKESDVWALGCILYHLLSGKPPFKGPNEYQTFQKITKLDYCFPDGFPEVAQDLVSRILVLDPAKRLTIPQIRTHAFFSGFDWTDLPSQAAPVLRPFLPATSDHNIVDLTSDMDQMTVGTGQFHGDVDAATRDPFAEVMNRQSSANSERDIKLAQQASSPLRRFLAHGELIVLSGMVHKRKGLFSKKRGLVLTDLPRLMFYDESKMEPKSEIPWSDKLTVELKGGRHFFVHTPKRTYYLECAKGDVDAKRWVECICSVHKTTMSKK